ncbi:MAG TPA: HupE/UreJ family protein [Alphaproteobacteria bacterium]|nr:HupE/UreJ family protein [Alphaproteobacteria bacterium]
MRRPPLASALPPAAFAVAALAAGPAAAHTFGTEGGGFALGLLHPLVGADHLLAMFAVGLWAWQLGGRAVWAVPGSFVAVMAAGAGIALAGWPMPAVETGIAASVLLLGLLVAAAVRLPPAAAAGLVGLFALFHGAAHGLELPRSAGPLAYGAGFLAATALLHAAGIGLAALMALRRSLWLRASGLAVGMAGLGFLYA